MSVATIQEDAAEDDGMDLEDPTAQSSHSDEERSVMEGDSEHRVSRINDSQVAMIDLPNDTYTMFFLSKLGGQAFYYAAYIFILKMILFSFLTMETYGDGRLAKVEDATVRVAQFLLLPVAVAIQDDLISAYYIFVNIEYSQSIQTQNPCAYKWKFRASNLFRCIDGFFSLLVNFSVLMSATEVLSLFLNFAALQFLQNIDNVALTLAAEGYFSNNLETVANHVIQAKLPKSHLRGKRIRYLDSGLFVATLVVLLVMWSIISFGNFW